MRLQPIWVAGLISVSLHLTQVGAAKYPLTAAMMDTAPVPTEVELSIYPSCPATPERTIADDLDYLVYKLDKAPYNSEPFQYTYFCDAFHPKFFADIIKYFPPTKVMRQQGGGGRMTNKTRLRGHNNFANQ
eukprot:3694932-Pyramimonas_sp.AAC.1